MDGDLPQPWLRDRHWVLLDVFAAVGLLALNVTGALFQEPRFGAPGWLAVTAAVVVAAPLAVRRRWPVPVLVAVLAANTVLVLLAVSGDPAVVVALALYTVTLPGRRPLIALAAALSVTVAAETVTAAASPSLEPQTRVQLVVASALALTAGWALGTAVTTRRRYAAWTAEDLTRHAVAEERLRIARELHDVITHSMSLMTVKAGVAHYLLGSRPEELPAALTVIETTGRQALTDLRRMLGVLRAGPADPSPDTGRTPAPRLTDLTALADRVTGAGVHVDLELDGDPDVPAGLALSTYRIVQEALTNVVRHAGPTRCHVRVDITDVAVTIEVTNDGGGTSPAPPTGVAGRHGLAGMRERAALFGGTVDAGPTADGGFRVTASLPRTPTAPTRLAEPRPAARPAPGATA